MNIKKTISNITVLAPAIIVANALLSSTVFADKPGPG